MVEGEGVADRAPSRDVDTQPEDGDRASTDEGVEGGGGATLAAVVMDEWREWHDSGKDWRPDVYAMPSYRELRQMLGEEKQRTAMLRRLLNRRIEEFLAKAVDPGYLLELRERGLVD